MFIALRELIEHKFYCPFCNREIHPSEETRYGVFCCKQEFWLSQCKSAKV